MNLVVCSKVPRSAFDLGKVPESDFHLIEMGLSDFDFPTLESGSLRRKDLSRVIVRLPGEQLDQLDALVEMLNRSDPRLYRSCAMRAALGMWTAIAKTTAPAIVLEAVQKAHVPRGRRGEW